VEPFFSQTRLWPDGDRELQLCLVPDLSRDTDLAQRVDRCRSCRQGGGHPPALCRCRPLEIEQASDSNSGADVAHTRLGSALTAFLRPTHRNVA